MNNPSMPQTVRWSSLPFNEQLTDGSLDDLIFCWIHVKQISYYVIFSKVQKYQAVLSRLLPVVTSCPQSIQTVESAFHRAEKTTVHGIYASDELYRTIKVSYSSFDNGKHLSPYTSIVGPSGIGKSFAVYQLSNRLGMYVIYSSLAPQDAYSYPKRSDIANVLHTISDKQHLECFWECYLTIGILDAEMCRETGVSATGFFQLQTKEAYSSYRWNFSTRVYGFFCASTSLRMNHRTAFEQGKDGLIKSSRDVLLQFKPLLEENSHNDPSPPLPPPKDYPRNVICIDEAHALLDGNEMLRFRSLRMSLRKRFRRTSTMGKVNLSALQGDLFAILLDTTSRVANCSPPRRVDPSQKAIAGWEFDENNLLFPPVFALDTTDLFVDPGSEAYPDGSDEAVGSLMRAGRPLWGGRMDAGDSYSNMIDLAYQKTRTGTPSIRALACLSYRLNFYVANYSLADELVSDHLRYVMYVNEARNLIRTTQPSEPILAHIAADRMWKPNARLEIIKQFVSSSFEGSTNIGDLGEMAAGIILMFAFDESLFGDDKTLPHAVTLQRFMKSLLGPAVQNTVDEAMRADLMMESLWKDGLVFCNHFDRAPSPPDQKTLQKAFRRGCAIFLPNNFIGADILIPVSIGDGKVVTFIAIQVKNRQNDVMSPGLKMEASSSLDSAVRALEHSEPSIGITMALGGQHGNQHGNQHVAVLRPISTRNGNLRFPQKNKMLQLLAVGLDENVYPAVGSINGWRTNATEEIPSLLKQLLGCVAGMSLPEDALNMYTRRFQRLDYD